MAQEAEELGTHLYFSQRWAIDGAFENYCKAKGLEYCILNFLCWLVETELGKAAIDAMHKEIHEK